MRIIRFVSDGKTHYGVPTDDSLARARAIEGEPFGSYRVTERQISVDRLLAPIAPTDILCIGLNYREHAREGGADVPENPMLFIKSSNTLNHPGASVPLPRLSKQIDYEGELVVVIGKDAKHVSRERAMEHVFGYCCANDVSSRDWQKEKRLNGGQFARGKSFDGFCPLGPFIVTRDEVPNPNALQLRTTLNGQLVQDCSTSDMIFDVPTLISSLSSTMTVRAGSVILTGTPHGVGFARNPPLWLKQGDRCVVEIEGVGRLENTFANE